MNPRNSLRTTEDKGEPTMCRYQQKLSVHLRIGEGPQLHYWTFLDIGTEAEVLDADNHQVARDLFLPKDADKVNSDDVRKLVLGAYEKSKYVGEPRKCRKGQVRTGKIGIIGWELKIGQFMASYSDGRLNIYSNHSLVISEKVDIPAFERFPVDAERLRAEMKRRLTEFHTSQLKRIEQL
jgi:hypothetical protein